MTGKRNNCVHSSWGISEDSQVLNIHSMYNA